ncbi:hypothetical protein [Laspinema olomoucense]|uniref:hypothetical protein n=1 Tax=Laspinema olomoucense TaxID=3231600 RepID=UPI0021BAC192|nr:hypothetical protein [Laspinema sp. D3a]MCT7987162.1 hypothetical protein [Laspinema sp. D3a]
MVNKSAVNSQNSIRNPVVTASVCADRQGWVQPRVIPTAIARVMTRWILAIFPWR